MTTARFLTDAEKQELDAFSRDGVALLGIDEQKDPAEKIVGLVDTYVYEWQRRTPDWIADRLSRPEEIIDLSWSLGAVWGDQIVREFGWHWALITDDQSEDWFGLVSPDRALSLYPSFYIRDCLTEPRMDFVAMLSFNMLRAGRFDQTAPASYLNLVQNIARIVPRA